jgi:hypothetical protein
VKPKIQRVNVDLPIPMLRAIDRECARLNIHRQAWIKMQLDRALNARPLYFDDAPPIADPGDQK